MSRRSSPSFAVQSPYPAPVRDARARLLLASQTLRSIADSAHEAERLTGFGAELVRRITRDARSAMFTLDQVAPALTFGEGEIVPHGTGDRG